MSDADKPPPVMVPEQDGSFLARWSRRKLEGEAGDEAPVARPVAEAEAREVRGAPPAEAPRDAGQGILGRLLRRRAAPAPVPSFDLSSLPSIESLTIESDIAAFLRQGVPAALRNAALRRAWSLDPAIRDFVGPADYAWDYNAPDGVPGFSLDLGGADLKKLLAQALGRLGEDEETGTEAEPPAAEPESMAAAPEPAPTDEPPALTTVADPEREYAGAMIPAEPSAAPTPTNSDVDIASQHPRRHGGAVPV